MTPEQRITELEVRITHQDETISELDQVVREFAERVLRLERALEELKNAGGAGPIGRPDEPPPHY